MSEVSVDSSSISSAIKLCQEAQNQLRMTTLSIRKQVDGIRSSWNDKKCDEFVQITEKCSSSLIKPIEGLDECVAKLREINQIIEEYDGMPLSSGNMSHNFDLTSEFSSLNIEDCNAALARDGRDERMVDISSAIVEGLSEEGFWSHHNKSEIEWEEGMSEYLNMMRDYSNGMSLDQCRAQYSQVADRIFFTNNDPIRVYYYRGSLMISQGRHRIAMAQRLGFRYLPAIVN